MQINNLKLLSKFYVARPNYFSSYKQKSEILHSLVRKWPSKKTKEHATLESVVPIVLTTKQ